MQAARRRRRGTIAAAALGAAALLAPALAGAQSMSEGLNAPATAVVRGCPPPSTLEFDGTGRVSLAPGAADDELTLPFDSDTGTMTDTVELRGSRFVGPAATVAAYVVGDPRLSDGHRRLGFPVVASATRTHAGTVDVEVCARRAGHHDEPGRYVGTVVVGGPGFASSQLRVELTIKRTAWWAVALSALGALGATLLALVVARWKADGIANREWRFVVTYLVPATAAVAVPALTAWLVLWPGSATWGSQSDMWKALVAGFVSGGTILGLFGVTGIPVLENKAFPLTRTPAPPEADADPPPATGGA